MRRFILPAVMLIALTVVFYAMDIRACTNGEWECSADGYVLKTCTGGEWLEQSCMAENGQLCDNGACVDPWRYGSPEWSRAEDEPRATKETLAEKAEVYEQLADRLLVHPELKWMMSAELACKKIDCPDGGEGPCEDCSQPEVEWDEATWKDVKQWHSGENDGLWSALYLAAEAFRYAATGDTQALDMVKTLMEGNITRSRVTGVPGLLTRQFIPPGIDGISCPETLQQYIPDREKDSNQWVKIGDAGCVEYVDPKTREWVVSDHCGLQEYAGWCWLDNVSKDEYSGHMFAYGVVAKLVDDPEVQQMVQGELLDIGKHMVRTGMEFTDWDGRVAEHGRVHAVTFGDYPGFNAAMGLSFVKVAAEATGDPRLVKWYDDCLLQKSGTWNCLKKGFESPKPYTEYLYFNGMYPGHEGCKANFNNISMHMLSMHNLVWFEHDYELRETYQKSLDEDVVRAQGQLRAVIYQNNAFFDFIWASQKRIGPGSDGPAYGAVENGVRMLRQFPAAPYSIAVQCPPEKCTEYCLDRFERPVSDYARETADRCNGTFIWWRDPYSLRSCSENRRFIHMPADYLLAYWMGRYYGFISADM